MLSAPDLLLLARRTAGISQAELARRLSRARSTVARWELGEMSPGYGAVMQAIEACGLAATVELANADSSYLRDVGLQRRREPIERLRRVSSGEHADMVIRLAERAAHAIIIGDCAAALHGWPLLLDPDGDVEVCASAAIAAELRNLDGLAVLRTPPGTRGYTDLRRDSELVAVPGGRVRVASPLDLLRIERAREHVVQAGAIEAVLEHRRRWPHGPPARRQYTEQEANAAIEASASARSSASRQRSTSR